MKRAAVTRKEGVVPSAAEVQVWAPAVITRPLRLTSGATAMTSGATDGSERARTSAQVSVVRTPRPWRTPLTVTVPGVTAMMFVPRRVRPLPMLARAPVPIPTVTMSAQTPMRIPREVSSERIRLPPTARRPLTIVWISDICSRSSGRHPPLSTAPLVLLSLREMFRRVSRSLDLRVSERGQDD